MKMTKRKDTDDHEQFTDGDMIAFGMDVHKKALRSAALCALFESGAISIDRVHDHFSDLGDFALIYEEYTKAKAEIVRTITDMA